MIRVVAGFVLLAAGIIWFLQGLNSSIAPESFMTGQDLWVVVGAVTAIVGAALAWWGARSRRDRGE